MNEHAKDTCETIISYKKKKNNLSIRISVKLIVQNQLQIKK